MFKLPDLSKTRVPGDVKYFTQANIGKKKKGLFSENPIVIAIVSSSVSLPTLFRFNRCDIPALCCDLIYIGSLYN